MRDGAASPNITPQAPSPAQMLLHPWN